MKHLYLLATATMFAFVMTFAPQVAGAKPCERSAKEFKSKIVAKWCREQDQKFVKKKMKCLKKKVKARKDTPKDWKCESCHKDLGGVYPTKPNAARDFKKWFSLLKPLDCK